jgi:hemerythrin
MKTNWNSNYSVGIEEIDKHHRIFFDYFALIEDSISTNESWSNVFYILERLEEYAKIHFSVEESLMSMYDYPRREEHVRSHKNFVATVLDIKRQSINSNLSKQTAVFMHQWLETHIKHEDSEYAQFILNGAHIVRAK